MRLAILSDIHANLDALEAVLAHAAGRYDALICLGDFVGYGPDPNACVDRLRDLGLLAAVVGNHDQAAAWERSIDNFNPLAAAAILWTREQLTEPVVAFLRGLPERDVRDSALLVHGSPRDPVDEYILDQGIARASFLAQTFRLAFVGHTHMPAIFELYRQKVQMVRWQPETPVAVDARRRYILNVGSVGQPRDGDPRAAYAVFDVDTRVATLYRVEYDFAATQAKMKREGLPEFLADRLETGR
jgi:diadenosine tetraphosphatase ApaH/serine/threonine PP2A family protein phosphatase